MKVSVIGAGNMGGALLRGWAKAGIIEKLIACDKNENVLQQLQTEFPQISITTDAKTAAMDADIVILVVKPWLMSSIAEEILPVLNLEKQLIVSDAANVGTEQLAQMLNTKAENAQLFYAIPNIAAEYGASMSFVASGKGCTKENTEKINTLYKTVGDVLPCEERLIGAGMMMASCGIAYVMRFIRAMQEGGVEMGFYPQEAKQIALQTMQGAVSLLKETGLHPEAAIDKVTTPGGVTIKGLNELDHAGFNSAVIRCLKAGL